MRMAWIHPREISKSRFAGMFLQMNSSVLLMRFDPTSRYLFASTHSCERKKLRHALTSGIQLTS